jgi:hypothetical protein
MYEAWGWQLLYFRWVQCVTIQLKTNSSRSGRSLDEEERTDIQSMKPKNNRARTNPFTDLNWIDLDKFHPSAKDDFIPPEAVSL